MKRTSQDRFGIYFFIVLCETNLIPTSGGESVGHSDSFGPYYPDDIQKVI